MRAKLSPPQALLLAGHPEEALKYADAMPLSEDSLYLRALCHRHAGRFDIAAGLIDQIIIKNPSNFFAMNTAGMLATDQGAFISAVDTFDVALELATKAGATGEKRAQIALNCAYAHMRLGQFENAWPMWEFSRFGYSWHAPIVPWSGQPGRVLVICEGGYGDQILFSRFLPLFEKPGIQLTYYCFTELADIMPNYGIPIIPHPKYAKVSRGEVEVPWNKFDYATSIMSLPAILRIKNLAELPSNIGFGYNRLPEQYRDGIGLCWEAEEIGVQRNSRSIDVELFEPLAKRIMKDKAMTGEMISLCPGRTSPQWLVDKPLNTWVDTANLLTRLKYVITIDTAVAHLAGVLDVPTYLLVPKGSDWKWFTRAAVGDTCPWYDSVQVIRNPDPVDWAAVMEPLKYRLEADGRI